MVDNGWDDIYTQIASDLLENPNQYTNKELYKKTANNLMIAVYKGLDGSDFPDDDGKNSLIKAFKINIEAFSYAKTLTQFKHFKDNMFDDKGMILNAISLKKVIADQGAIFNNQYLNVEHQFVTQSAIMADKWNNLDSEYLEFSTVGDNRVRPEHKLFDKFTALKTDPIWKRLYTPLNWNCRCTIIPGIAKNVSKEYDSAWAEKVVAPMVKGTIFDNNVGITNVIFKETHPYFKAVGAKNNEFVQNKEERKAKDVELKNWISKNIKKNEPIIITGKQFQNAEVRITKSNFENVLKHISSVENKEIIKDLKIVILNSEFKKNSELENKNSKNYGNKVARGVVSYNYYQSKWNGRTIEINMEVMKNGYEQPYAIVFDKK